MQGHNIIVNHKNLRSQFPTCFRNASTETNHIPPSICSSTKCTHWEESHTNIPTAPPSSME